MPHFEIWMEGFAATGQSSTAQKIWEGEAESFDDAVLKFEKEQSIKYDKPYKVDRYEGSQAKRSEYGIWACRLFDNEQDARKSFG